MNRIYTFILVCFVSISSFSQVAFTVISPASISGGYEFTSNGDAPNWGLANLLNPADAIQDTVVIYEDATPGINAQGIPHANEGCAPATIDLTGKIALIYRYDGVSTNNCFAGTKVLNAQNAGAIGVIMVNREDGVYGYDGTTDGPLTNIPFAFIGKSDGALIRAKIEAGEDVIAFIGNKLGLYTNDIGMVKVNTLAPSIAATAVLTAQNASEFGFDLGTTIYNYGSATQNNVILTATVSGPGGLWSHDAGPFTILPGDSVEIVSGGTNSIAAFSLTSYPSGNYTLEYGVSISGSDESTYDNSLSYNFVINDSVISFAKTDPTTNLPIANTYTRSQASGFSPCMVYTNSNGNRLATNGVYFSTEPGYNTGAVLDGEVFGVSLYQWDDIFVDLNDVDFGFSNLVPIATGEYQFGAGQEGQMVFAPFTIPFHFEDNQRYLACVDVFNDNFWIGFNNRIDYTKNIDYYLQPLAPIASNSTYYALGFGEHMVPAIGLGVFDATKLNVTEKEINIISVFPNPASDILTIQSNLNLSNVQILDFTGRLIKTIEIKYGTTKLNIDNLEKGNYLLVSRDENGKRRTTNFVKL